MLRTKLKIKMENGEVLKKNWCAPIANQPAR
jgi:hypothetical protein